MSRSQMQGANASTRRLARGAIIAAVSSTLCVAMGAFGGVLTLVASIPALAVISKRHGQDSAPADNFAAEYKVWLTCVLSFALVAICSFPFFLIKAVPVAFVALSPLLGTSSYVIEQALDPETERNVS